MKHNQMRQVVFPILAAFIWGTAFVAQDMCADSIGAFAFNASRYFIAVLALLVVIVISDKLKKDKPVLSPAAGHGLQLPAGGHGRRYRQRQGRLPDGAVCGAGSRMRSVLQAEGQPPRLDRRGTVRDRAVSAVHQR